MKVVGRGLGHSPIKSDLVMVSDLLYGIYYLSHMKLCHVLGLKFLHVFLKHLTYSMDNYVYIFGINGN